MKRQTRRKPATQSQGSKTAKEVMIARLPEIVSGEKISRAWFLARFFWIKSKGGLFNQAAREDVK